MHANAWCKIIYSLSKVRPQCPNHVLYTIISEPDAGHWSSNDQNVLIT